MEENIKILEEILKIRKEQKEIIECAGGYCGNCNPDIKALKNAIQTMRAYKELEQKYNKALSDLIQVEHKNKKLEEENHIQKSQLMSAFDNGFIHKSLVEEKIEELDKQEKQESKGLKGQDRYFVKQMYQYKRSILQELLEKRK